MGILLKFNSSIMTTENKKEVKYLRREIKQKEKIIALQKDLIGVLFSPAPVRSVLRKPRKNAFRTASESKLITG